MEQVKCPRCRKLLLVSAEAYARDCECPACGGVFNPDSVSTQGPWPDYPTDDDTPDALSAYADETPGPMDAPDGVGVDIRQTRPNILASATAPAEHTSEAPGPTAPLGRTARAGFIAGCLIALAFGLIHCRAAEPGTAVASIMGYGALCSVLVIALRHVYRHVPRGWRWCVHAGVGCVISLTVLAFILGPPDPRESTFAILFGMTFGSLLAISMSAVWFIMLIEGMHVMGQWRRGASTDTEEFDETDPPEIPRHSYRGEG